MFCPHCGKTNSQNSKFCRSCGLGLEKIAQSLHEQLPHAESKNLQARQKQVERLLTIIAGSAFSVFVIAILWAVIYKIIILKGEVFQGLMFLGLFLAAISALLLVVYRESLRESISKLENAQPSLTEAQDTGRLLAESKFEPAMSVTDRTTELLFAEKKTA